ncbi:MAG: hypothetical protein K0M45_02970 [Candidatus Paracaedibacteraceae bacterium]|nr:hypothetical protein [Candidatus Paracaedibacteraceae bacterium]
MLNLIKYLSIIAATASSLRAGEDFIQGVYETSCTLHHKMESSQSNIVSGLGTTLAVQSIASLIHPTEKKLKAEINDRLMLSSKPAALEKLTSALRNNLIFNLSVYTDIKTTIKKIAITSLKKTGAQNIQINLQEIIPAEEEKYTKKETLIQGLIKGITADTVLCLFNIIHVTAAWRGKYAPTSFPFSIKGEKQSIQGFYGAQYIKRIKTSTDTIFALKTMKDIFSLLIKLPKKKQPISPLSYEDVNNFYIPGEKRLTLIHLPNIIISSLHNLQMQLQESLPTLLDDTFLTTIFDIPISIGAFKQKAVVKWDENGLLGDADILFDSKKTESIAQPSLPERTIKVNRPFAFMVVLNKSDNNPTPVPIFSGQIASWEVLRLRGAS